MESIMLECDTPLTLEPSEAHPRHSEGAFVTLRDGTLLLAYSRFFGGGGDDSRAEIVALTSSDGGRTWSDEGRVLIADEGRQNVMSVSFVRLGDGRIALFYGVKHGFHDLRTWMRTSADEGATWSEPLCCIPAPGYHVVNNDRVVRLSDGRLVVPAAFHRRKLDATDDWRTFDSRAVAIFFLSDDDGASWRESATWWSLPMRSNTGLQEPGLIELADGRLYAWARTDLGCQWGMQSTDRGDTWSLPTPTPFPSPPSPLSMKRLPNGALLAVFNDTSDPDGPVERSRDAGGPRRPLAAWVSRDEACTWRRVGVIDDEWGRGFSYPAIHFTEEHALFAYCAGAAPHGNLKALRIRRVPLAAPADNHQSGGESRSAI
jgi:predicted neuraminidase